MACTHTRTRTHTPGKGIYTEFDFDNAFHPKKKLNIGLRKKKKDEAMKWRRDDENRFTHDFINSPQILLFIFVVSAVQRCTEVYRGVQFCVTHHIMFSHHKRFPAGPELYTVCDAGNLFIFLLFRLLSGRKAGKEKKRNKNAMDWE